jgi:hypothetical protein
MPQRMIATGIQFREISYPVDQHGRIYFDVRQYLKIFLSGELHFVSKRGFMNIPTVSYIPKITSRHNVINHEKTGNTRNMHIAGHSGGDDRRMHAGPAA